MRSRGLTAAGSCATTNFLRALDGVNNAGVTADGADPQHDGRRLAQGPALNLSGAREAAFALARSDTIADDGIGLTVNAVTPGLIETEMTAAVPAKVIESLKAAIPTRRMGRPEEIARVVAFLAADASAYITGQVWGVNGGLDM
jgi:NAD(P)-dependent dehydrogenase (short-subunit alcohol dehydrogenase family)